MREVAYLGLTEATGPTTRYRFVQYQCYLLAAGLRPALYPLLGPLYMRAQRYSHPPRWLLRNAAYAAGALRRLPQVARSLRASVVVVERECFPYLPPWLEALLARRPQGYVLEIDDAQHETPGRREKLRRVAAQARHVVVGNEVLATWARQYNPSVHVVPTVVDLSRYERAPRASRPGTPRIGWVGLPYNFDHLASIAPVVGPLVQAGRAELVVCSARPPRLGFPVTFVPWSETTEAEVLGSWDIGVMPLEDTPYARGKCGLKLLQYMAASLPVVASPVGVNRQLVEHGERGYLATTLNEWRDALNRLLESAQTRIAMGERGRAFVREHYSLQTWGPRLGALYAEWAQES